MLKKKRFSLPIFAQILIGMIVGVVIGYVAIQLNGSNFINDWIRPWGQLFIRLLQLIAVPLVFFSLIKGITGLNDISKFSSLGGRTLVLYFLTTIFAVLLGLSLGLLVKPGELVNEEKVAHIQEEYYETVAARNEAAKHVRGDGPLEFLNDIVPGNIISATADNSKMLQVIFFALFFGVASLMLPNEKVKPVINLINSVTEIILKMVQYIICLAPYGVAALMAGLVVDFEGDISMFSALGVYALTVSIGLLFFILVFYPLLIKWFTKIPVLKFMKVMYPVQVFAFSTSSSAATLPVTMEATEKGLGVSKDVCSFVLPIGATINMDGTSCYQTIATLFIAQVLGIDLSLGQLLTIVFMTILSSIGTPAIPGGSYVVLTMVLTSVGIPAEGLALIIGIDRPLDMLRTSVNVTGDAVIAAAVDKA